MPCLGAGRGGSFHRFFISGERISAMGRAVLNIGVKYGQGARVLNWNVENHLESNDDNISLRMSIYNSENVAIYVT